MGEGRTDRTGSGCAYVSGAAAGLCLEQLLVPPAHELPHVFAIRDAVVVACLSALVGSKSAADSIMEMAESSACA